MKTQGLTIRTSEEKEGARAAMRPKKIYTGPKAEASQEYDEKAWKKDGDKRKKVSPCHTGGSKKSNGASSIKPKLNKLKNLNTAVALQELQAGESYSDIDWVGSMKTLRMYVEELWAAAKGTEIPEAALELFETVVICSWRLYRADSIPELVLSAVEMYKMLTGKSFMKLIASNVEKVVNHITSRILKMQSDDKGFFEKKLDSFNDIFERVDGFTSSRFWLACKEVITYIMSLALGIIPSSMRPTAWTTFYESVETSRKTDKEQGTFSFFSDLCKNLLYVMRKGAQAVRTRNFHTLFHDSVNYEKWLKSYFDIKNRFEELNSPNSDTCSGDLLADADKFVRQGKEILNVTDKKTSSMAVGVIEKYITSVTQIKIYLEIQGVRDSSRLCPFSVLLYGQPKAGKSVLTEYIFQWTARARGWEPTDENKYVRQVGDPFWSGVTSGKKCIIIDDIASESSMALQKGEATSVSELITLINNVAITPNMADLESKGKIVLRPDIVIGTSNSVHLGAESAVSCPYAVNRRFPYVILLSVKEPFRDADNAPNWDAVAEAERGTGVVFSNIWDFVIYKPVLDCVGKNDIRSAAFDIEELDKVMKGSCHFEVLHHIYEINSLRLWFVETLHKHFKQQELVSRKIREIGRQEWCEDCGMRECECVEDIVELREAEQEETKEDDDEVIVDLPVLQAGEEYDDWQFNPDDAQYCTEEEAYETHSFIRSLIIGMTEKAFGKGRGGTPTRFYWWFVNNFMDLSLASRFSKIISMTWQYSMQLTWKWFLLWLSLSCGFQVLHLIAGGIWSALLCVAFLNLLFQSVITHVVHYLLLKFMTSRWGAWSCFWVLKRLGWRNAERLTHRVMPVVPHAISLVTILLAGTGISALAFKLVRTRHEKLDLDDVTVMGATPDSKLHAYGGRIFVEKKPGKWATIFVSKVKAGIFVAFDGSVYRQKDRKTRETVPMREFEAVQEALSDTHLIRLDMEDQAAVELQQADEFEIPRETVEERKNEWYVSDEPTCATDISDTSHSCKADPEIFFKKVEKNVVKVTSFDRDRGRKRTVNGLMLKGQLCLLPAHLGTDFPIRELEIVENRGNILNRPLTAPVSPYDVKKIPQLDIMVVRIPEISQYPSVLDMFAKSPITDIGCPGTMVKFGGKDVERVGCTSVQYNALSLPFSLGAKIHCYTANLPRTQTGDCGSPYVALTPSGPILLGPHIAYLDDAEQAVCIAYTQQMMHDVLRKFPVQLECGEILNVAPCHKLVLGPLHHKSFLREIEGSTKIWGSAVRGFRTKERSQVMELPTAPSVRKRGVLAEFSGPNKHVKSVAVNAVQPLFERNTRCDLKHLEQAYDDIINKLENLPDNLFRGIRVVEIDEAINGIDGEQFCEGMRMSTSEGAPHFRGKKNYFQQDPTTLKWAMGAIVREEYDEIVRCLEQGKRANPIFNVSLKDEVLPKAKVDAGKCRAFTACPAAFAVLTKRVTMTILAFLHKNRIISEIYAGTSVQSKDWHRMRKMITMFGPDRMIAGDFKRFDTVAAAARRLEKAWNIIMFIARRAGYSAYWLDMLDKIRYDTFFPCTYVNGELVTLEGKETSGNVVTVDVNGLVNSLLMRQAYFALAPEGAPPFDSYVTLLTYGDDNVMNVHPSCHWFNHTTISDYLRESEGVIYTMADKEAESRPFITIDEVSFLKRTWRWDEDTQTYLAPLEEDSIWKMITYGLPSKAMDPRHLSVVNLDTALRERFFYGRKIFDKERQWTLGVVDELALNDCVARSHFPFYEEMLAAYERRSRNNSELRVYDLQSHEVDDRTLITTPVGQDDGTWGIRPPVRAEDFTDGWAGMEYLPIDSVTVDRVRFSTTRAITERRCHDCNHFDCIYRAIDSVVCPRCRRCRPYEPDLDDKWFLGCFFCESEYPLVCDGCGSRRVCTTVLERRHLRLFFCAVCLQGQYPCGVPSSRTSCVATGTTRFDPQ